MPPKTLFLSHSLLTFFTIRITDHHWQLIPMEGKALSLLFMTLTLTSFIQNCLLRVYVPSVLLKSVSSTEIDKLFLLREASYFSLFS